MSNIIYERAKQSIMDVLTRIAEERGITQEECDSILDSVKANVKTMFRRGEDA